MTTDEEIWRALQISTQRKHSIRTGTHSQAFPNTQFKTIRTSVIPMCL